MPPSPSDPSHAEPAQPRKARRRGGQPGNSNHLKHGIYSRHMSIEADDDVQTMPEDQNRDELALARVRLAACLEKQKHAPPEQWLFYEKAISQYLVTTARLIHNNAVLGKDRKAALVTVLEMIRQLNEKENVS